MLYPRRRTTLCFSQKPYQSSFPWQSSELWPLSLPLCLRSVLFPGTAVSAEFPGLLPEVSRLYPEAIFLHRLLLIYPGWISFYPALLLPLKYRSFLFRHFSVLFQLPFEAYLLRLLCPCTVRTPFQCPHNLQLKQKNLRKTQTTKYLRVKIPFFSFKPSCFILI